MNVLEIQNLHASVEGKQILKGIDLTIKSGEIHAIMGPNGSGKSTLCNVLMDHPKYEVTDGTISLNEEDITELDPAERAHRGLFLAFQHPTEIPGVTYSNFLRTARNSVLKANDEKAKLVDPLTFQDQLSEAVDKLKIKTDFNERSVNSGFSGGERKRAEIVQMSILQPKIVLLDEIDSGLDIDALRIVAEGIKDNFKKHNLGILIITHYQRLLDYITPDFVHVMSDGKIIKSGTEALAKELEAEGYEQYTNA